MRRKGAEKWEEKEKKLQRKEENQMGVLPPASFKMY